MIETREQLKVILKQEESFYIPEKSSIRRLKNRLLAGPNIMRWKYVRTLRKLEYYRSNRNKSLWFGLMNMVIARKFHSLGFKLGIEMEPGVFAEGLQLYHTHGVVINGDAKVGKNCILHGANVIGNMGNNLKVPVLGDNVRLGAGAKVFGDVYIADGVQIGAGAIVLESCYEKNALLVGIPAHIHRK